MSYLLRTKGHGNRQFFFSLWFIWQISRSSELLLTVSRLLKDTGDVQIQCSWCAGRFVFLCFTVSSYAELSIRTLILSCEEMVLKGNNERNNDACKRF